MDPVSNANRIAMLLRRRLEERSRASAAGRTGRKTVGSVADAPRRSGVQAAAAEELDDQQLRRVVVENILADQFGDRFVNDAGFQQVVDQVTDAIRQDDKGALVLAQVLADLRKKG
jgi:hypothetical protein